MLTELREAQALGLIPAIIENADFTQPITRAEFAHLVITLCETYTGVSTVPSSNNPFTDFDDEMAFKAYGFGIMQGTNAQGNEFSPEKTLNRETMAFMFYRTVRLIAPLADYSVPQKPAIPDEDRISPWAAPSVAFLYSSGIILGANNSKFMPKPVSASQIESNYGIATREQCVVISKRLFEALPEIEGSRFKIGDKIAEIMSFAKDEPQGGEELSRDELADILRPYALRVRWADNMAAVSFTGDFRKTGDSQWAPGYDSAFLYNAFSAKGLSQYKFDEEQTLWGVAAGQSRFALNIFDADEHRISSFLWDSEKDTGAEYGAPLAATSFFSPLTLTSYMPSRLSWTYKLFDDEVVGGELCKVFSVTSLQNLIEEDEEHEQLPALSRGVPPVERPPSEVETTDYFYVSTVSGLCVAQKNYATLRDTTYQSISIVFNISPSLTDAGLIRPPSDIEFILN